MNNNDRIGVCIYCGNVREFSREHYLPDGLGRFENDERLQFRLCGPCNNALGREIEEPFLRVGPMGFFRQVVGVIDPPKKIKKRGPRPSPFYRGSKSTPPVKNWAKLPGSDEEILVNIAPGTTDVFPLNQLVLKAGGERHHVPIPDSVETPEQLDELLEKQGFLDSEFEGFYACDQDYQRILRLTTRHREGALSPPLPLSFPAQEVEIRSMVTVGAEFFRAVAKIGFHYTLKQYSDLFDGSEGTFEPIRRYIRDGEGDRESFVKERPDQFASNFSQGGRPKYWMHILSSSVSLNFVVARCQFFAGPTALHPGFDIRIGNNPMRIELTQDLVKAHQFVYTRPAGYDGIMVDAEPLQKIVRPNIHT